MMLNIRTIARMEFVATARLWWIRLFTSAYVLMTVAMAYASGVVGETDPAEGFARLLIAVLPLALMLVPLASLMIGTTGAASDDATGFLLAQPISRTEHLLGRWLGQAGAVSVSLAAGFGAGGALVSVIAGASDFAHLGMLVAACMLVGLTFLSIATLIACATARRGVAVGTAAFVWFFAVILYDAVMLGIALWATGTSGARVLFLSIFGNAIDLVRLLTLLFAGTPHVLGAAGESWLRALGGMHAAMLMSAAAVVVWLIGPLAAAIRIQQARDV